MNIEERLRLIINAITTDDGNFIGGPEAVAAAALAAADASAE